jgi:hypothetical protein
MPKARGCAERGRQSLVRISLDGLPFYIGLILRDTSFRLRQPRRIRIIWVDSMLCMIATDREQGLNDSKACALRMK